MYASIIYWIRDPANQKKALTREELYYYFTDRMTERSRRAAAQIEVPSLATMRRRKWVPHDLLRQMAGTLAPTEVGLEPSWLGALPRQDLPTGLAAVTNFVADQLVEHYHQSGGKLSERLLPLLVSGIVLTLNASVYPPPRIPIPIGAVQLVDGLDLDDPDSTGGWSAGATSALDFFHRIVDRLETALPTIGHWVAQEIQTQDENWVAFAEGMLGPQHWASSDDPDETGTYWWWRARGAASTGNVDNMRTAVDQFRQRAYPHRTHQLGSVEFTIDWQREITALAAELAQAAWHPLLHAPVLRSSLLLMLPEDLDWLQPLVEEVEPELTMWQAWARSDWKNLSISAYPPEGWTLGQPRWDGHERYIPVLHQAHTQTGRTRFLTHLRQAADQKITHPSLRYRPYGLQHQLQAIAQTRPRAVEAAWEWTDAAATLADLRIATALGIEIPADLLATLSEITKWAQIARTRPKAATPSDQPSDRAGFGQK